MTHLAQTWASPGPDLQIVDEASLWGLIWYLRPADLEQEYMWLKVELSHESSHKSSHKNLPDLVLTPTREKSPLL